MGEPNDGADGRPTAGEKRTQWKAPVQTWLAYFLLLFMAHPAIIKNALEMFNCATFGQVSVLRVDPELSCNSAAHDVGVTIADVMLLAFSVGLPAAALADISRKRRGDETTKRQLVKRYNFLLVGYCAQYWYWEFVVQLRKVTVVILVVFFRSDVFDQTYLGLTIVAVALVFQIACKPFDSHSCLHANPFSASGDDFNSDGSFNGYKLHDKTLETISLVVSCFTMLGSIAC